MSTQILDPTLPPPTVSAVFMPMPRANKQNGHLPKPTIYPDDDGNPMSNNTEQFEKIVAIHSGYDGIYLHNPNVFVAGDLLWYPVEGNNVIRQAPDVMLVFGRPKGYRGSYKQWEEGNITPQVVFEILSPGNRLTEMAKKLAFYDRYGVEEYYLYDPDSGDLSGWWRANERLEVIDEMRGWISPRTQVRFELEDKELVLYRPDGQRFETYRELLVRVEQEKERAEQEKERAEQEKERAEQEKERAEQEKERAAQEHARAERLAAQLRALGIDPDSVTG
jgi:Uma2 family endonuclease